MAGRPAAALASLNLNLLRSLAVLIEERSVSRAATRLGVTQSAVSHALAQLREQLGDALLVRGATGMVPTPRAERLAARVRGAIEELERALAETTAFDPATTKRTFTLASGDHMAGVIVQAMAWMGLREAPEVSVRVVPFEPQRLATQLQRGEVDVAVGPSIADRLDLRQTLLFSDRVACIVRRDHPEVKGALTLDQLRRLPHVMLSSDETLRRVEDALRDQGVTRRVSIEVPYFLLAPSIIPFADFLLIAPRTLGSLFARGYPLRVLDLPVEVPDVRMNAYWHERYDADSGHQWLLAQVRRCVKSFFEQSDMQTGVVVGEWTNHVRELQRRA